MSCHTSLPHLPRRGRVVGAKQDRVRVAHRRRPPPRPSPFARGQLPRSRRKTDDHGPLRPHRPQRRLHAGQAGDPFRGATLTYAACQSASPQTARALKSRARRRPRRPRRDPQPQPSRLSGAALCLRAARRDAGAAQLAARGAGAGVHPVRCGREGAGGRAGLCGRRRAAASRTARRHGRRPRLRAGGSRSTICCARAAATAATRMPISPARCCSSTPPAPPAGRRARCCARRRWSGTP